MKIQVYTSIRRNDRNTSYSIFIFYYTITIRLIALVGTGFP